MSESASPGVSLLPRIFTVASGVCSSLMSRRIRRSTEPNRNSAAVLASSVLPVPVGPGKQEHADGLARIVEARLEHGDTLDDGAHGFGLPHHPGREE